MNRGKSNDLLKRKALPASGLKTLRAKLKVLLRLGKSGRFHRATLVGKYEPRCLTAKLKALTVKCLSLVFKLIDYKLIVYSNKISCNKRLNTSTFEVLTIINTVKKKFSSE
jgi:hypothetical protein